MDFVKEDTSGPTRNSSSTELEVEDDDVNKVFDTYKGKGFFPKSAPDNDMKSFRLQHNFEEADGPRVGEFGIDPRIWTLKKLTLLDLSGGSDEDEQLQHLGPIDVNSPIKMGLPELSELRDLILSNNLIGPTIEPDGCLYGLANLRTLNLEKNLITSLPPSLVSLTALTTLNVNHNSLEALPGVLGLLPALQTVLANDNKITCEGLNSASSGLVDTPRLSTLHLARNKLEGMLPSFLGNMKALNDLDIRGNSLTALPEVLAQLKLKKLEISENKFSDKKLLKLASSSKQEVKAILQLLRKGKSRRKAKEEKLEEELANRPTPERKYNSSGDEIKQILLHREAMSVRPVVCAVLLHIVESESDSDEPEDWKELSKENAFFFGCDSDAPGPSFETEIALIEQKEFFDPRISDGGDQNYGMEFSKAALSTVERFRAFISAQTRIHHEKDLGNKRRNGAMGSHNASEVIWPLHFTAAKHDDEKFIFSPLRDGWMEAKGKSSARRYAEKALQIADLKRHAQTLLALPRCPFLYMNNADDETTVLSVAPLTNGWETRTTPLAQGGILLECSSGEESNEKHCRKMLLEMIKESIKLLETGKRIVLVEQVDTIREWDKKLLYSFPSYEEFMELPLTKNSWHKKLLS